MPALVIPTLATLCKVSTFLTSLVSTKRLSIDISTPKVILTIYVPIYFLISLLLPN
nr:MAG TPA: hypothetical protein [Caudoviricetes sp.]